MRDGHCLVLGGLVGEDVNTCLGFELAGWCQYKRFLCTTVTIEMVHFSW